MRLIAVAFWCCLACQAADLPRITTDLAAADAARAALAAETAAWQAEDARFAAALAVLAAEERRLQEGLAAQEQELAARSAELAAEGPLRRDWAATRDQVAALAQQLRAGLVERAGRSWPGVIPVPGAEGAEADAALRAALDALEHAERALAATATAVLVGVDAAGEERAVRLLRLGGVLAWWQALDGSAVGTARMRDGVLQLAEVSEPLAVEAIARALAIAAGRQLPELVLLPVAGAP